LQRVRRSMKLDFCCLAVTNRSGHMLGAKSFAQ
jgi:hypothetical protein